MVLSRTNIDHFQAERHCIPALSDFKYFQKPQIPNQNIIIKCLRYVTSSTGTQRAGM